MKHRRTILTVILAAGLASGRNASAAAVSYLRDVQPILADRCYSCHGPEKQKGGLRLDRKTDALAGGDNGKVIVPRKSAESVLIRNVSGLNPDSVMPPKGERLKTDQISTLRRWIDEGADWPDDQSIAGTRNAGHWSFRPPQRPNLPTVRNARFVRNSIDAFVLSRLEKEKIAPSPEADKVTLIRRLNFDLIGLPPTPEEVRDFLNDRRPQAYADVVDRLLRSPHFGERWARHWLDLARYADSDGYEKDGVRPYAYLYRDWVIEAINRDLPFDQFSIEQIAGDLLPDASRSQKVATGFHRQTLTNKEGGVDQEEFRCKATVDRATTTGAIWLGLTVGCAECHTHKYDPITQREFYQFYAFFNNTTEREVPASSEAEVAKYDEQKRRWDEQNAKLKAAVEVYLTNGFVSAQEHWLASAAVEGGSNALAVTKLLKTPAAERTTNEQSEITKYFREKVDPTARKLDAQLAAHAKKEPKPSDVKASILVENQKPLQTHIHVRGDFLRKGEEVQPGTFAALHPFHPRGSRPDRLDLARWLFDAQNPLTSRVTVNHIWLHLFGRGLVNTVNDFGTRGEAPSHPELLDWLASELPRLGWSRKALIRLIVNSATYRQASAARPELLDRDANNTQLARQNRIRLEAELVRDSVLACSGLLEPTVGGPGIKPPLPPDIAAVAYANSVKWKESAAPERNRRGLYIFLQRTIPYPMLVTFDGPEGNVTCTRRERSNTPLQALTLLNDSVFFEAAQVLGQRLAADRSLNMEQKMVRAFQICLGRSPTRPEVERLQRFQKQQRRLLESSPGSAAKIAGQKPASANVIDQAVLVTMARTIMNLDEFLTRE